MRKMFNCKRTHEDLMYFELWIYSRSLALGISGSHINRVKEMQNDIRYYDEIEGNSEDIEAVINNINNIIENYDLINNMKQFYRVQMYK